MATQSAATATHLLQWQPDETAVACPLCDTVFSWWYRKHHCRRCARVVCGACAGNFCLLKASAVVRPPGQAPFSLATATSPSLWSSTGHGRPSSAGSTTGRPASVLSSGADTAVEEVRCCDACFSQLEQDRSRRMLGLDIAHLDPRTAAQLIRELATTGGATSPTAAEARKGAGAGGGAVVAAGTPPPCYSHAPAVQASALTRAETASQHVAIASQGGQRVRQGHRRRHPDSGASASTPLSSALQLPASSPVVPLRYVTFQLTLSDKILGEECPICFEEYEEGQLAARLECWCVFHEGCIKAWRDTKDGTHGCPLHFHD